MRYALLVLGVVAFGVGIFGCESGPCTVPTGTYTMEVSSVSGNCDTSIVNSVTSTRQDFVIDEEGECGTINVSQTLPIDGTECMMHLVMSADGTADGIEEGDLVVDISNCGDLDCSHEFNLWIEGH